MAEAEVLTKSVPTNSGETQETTPEVVVKQEGEPINEESNTQENDDIDFDELEEEEGKESASKDNTDKPKKQSKAENKKYAEMRKAKREREQQELEKQSYKKGLLEATNGVNPYTQEKIETDEDVEEFKLMQEMASKGLDPITDFHKFYKQKKVEERSLLAKAQEEKVKQEQLQQEAQKRYESDITDFKSKNEDVDVNELLTNEKFLIFAEGKIGVKPLANIYTDYLTFANEYETKAKETAKKMVAINTTSVGSLSSGKGNDKKVDYSTMSKAEFEAKLEKVKRGW